jgi:hypothetical protein
MRGAYNDYLWQLALKDSTAPQPTAAPRGPDERRAGRAAERPAIEPGEPE